MNTYDPQKHHRRSIRLKGYDYTQPGAYFVTICTQGRVCLFGDVVNGEMQLNPFGRVAATYWERIPRHAPHVQLGTWVVMPNHIHGIIIITDTPPRRGKTFPATAPNSMQPGSAPSSHQPNNDLRECLAPPQTPYTPRQGKGETFPPPPNNAGRREAPQIPAPPWPDGECLAPTSTSSWRRSAGAPAGSLGAIVGNVQSIITRRINKMRHTPGARVLQRNYWEHIIRTPASHARIEDYIMHNPARWQKDQLHPDAPPNPFNQESP